eukprot:scaffold713_cov131-Cylindrotheca_fusiformis.AAC.23
MKLISAAVLIGMSFLTEAMPDIQVTLRGKKYDIESVDTVQELQEQLSVKSGVEPSKQGRVLFNGKRMSAEENLAAAGVKDGDQLNIVPKSKSKSSSSGSSKKTTTSSSSSTLSASTPTASSSSSSSSNSSPAAPGGMEDILKRMGNGGLDDLMKSMGGGEGGAPSMQESLEMMSSMMNSPMFKELMSDPERLEASRQMILNNPMLKSMMGGMPGMEELLNSPEAWREAMQAAVSMYQNMDQDELMQAMMGGAGGAGMPGGGMPGLFDGESNGMAALDELSEGED